MIRPSMVRILFRRELKRLRKNPSALTLIGLLAAIALLAATSDPANDPQANESAQNSPVVVVYDRDTPLVRELRNAAPPEGRIRFMKRSGVSNRRGDLVVPPGWSIVELRNDRIFTRECTVVAHHNGEDPEVLAPVWAWFTPTVTRVSGAGLWVNQQIGPRTDARAKAITDSSLSDLVRTELIGTTLLLMVQFFACCHLLVSFTAEDRERKTLTALALSPARLSEIMIAKAMFHMSLSIVGSALIVGIISPAALTRPVLWVTLLLTSTAMMSVGTCIATLARNQASAGMLALCYMMAGAMLFFLATKLRAFAVLKGFSFESYSFPLLYYTFKYPTASFLPYRLLPLFVLTTLWVIAARTCFYRFGWRS